MTAAQTRPERPVPTGDRRARRRSSSSWRTAVPVPAYLRMDRRDHTYSTGDRVLLGGDASHTLVIHPLAALHVMLAEVHATALGGETP